MLSLLGTTVAVAAIGDPDKSKGGLYIPDVAKERSDQGVVKYIGPDVKDVKVGDYVLFSGWTGTAIHIEGERGLLIFLPEDEIECVVHQADTPIAGLYHMSRDGGMFPATYESAIAMLREQFFELPRKVNFKDRKVPG